MSQEGLESLRKSIKVGDYFALVYFIIFLILYVLSISSYIHIIGVIIGYISVKFVFERQSRKYATKDVTTSSDLFFNIIVYAVAMFLMVLVGTPTLLVGALLIIIYRHIVLYKFKTLT